MTSIASSFETLTHVQPLRIRGVVSALRGLTILVDELPLPVGSMVSIGTLNSQRAPTLGEIVGFTREHAIIMLLGQAAGIRAGDPVYGIQSQQSGPVGRGLLGRVVDGLGRPVDLKPAIRDVVARAINPEPIRAMTRRRINEQLLTGVRAVDLFTPMGRGQRLGVFAGPGVGKSTLLGTIARRTNADVNVIALIGERGREVKDFIEHSLGPEGLARSVVVVATGDESPLLRIRAAKLACTCAEHFRDQGADVLLMMDSVTRFAHAQRQVGLSVGEPPATKGYTPSVFSSMALLLERAGAIETSAIQTSAIANTAKPAKGGSVTGLYTILVEGDDMSEPIADAARGILDGHIILSRKLAQKAHYPAIDVLDSISRVGDDVTDTAHQSARRQLVRTLALYREIEDLVQIGAYARGSNPEADVAIEHQAAIIAILRQSGSDAQPFQDSKTAMIKLATQITDATQRAMKTRSR